MSLSQLDSLDNEISDIKNKISSYNEEVGYYERRIIEKRMKLESFLERISKKGLLSNMESKNEEVSNLFQRNENSKRVINLMIDEIESIQEESKYIEEKIENSYETKIKLNTFFVDLSRRISDVTNENNQLRNKIKIQNQAKEQSTRELSIITNKFNEDNGLLVSKEYEINKEKIKINKVLDEIEMYNKRLEEESTSNKDENNIDSSYLMDKNKYLKVIEKLDDKRNIINGNLMEINEEISKNKIEYLKLTNVVNEIKYNYAKISKNNLNNQSTVNQTIERLYEKVNCITGKNEELEMSFEIKKKIINSLKEINSINQEFDNIINS